MSKTFLELLNKCLTINGVKIKAPMDYMDVRLCLPNTWQAHYGYNNETRDDEKGAMQLTELIINKFRNPIKFIPLLIPKNVLVGQLHRHDDILARYLEQYKLMSYEIVTRWDILIQGEYK